MRGKTTDGELTFVSYGIHIAVRVSAPELLEPVRRHLPPRWKPSIRKAADRSYSFGVSEAGIIRKYTLSADSEQLTESERLTDLLETFESDSRLFIAEMTTRKVFLHAGVVGWRGKAIIIPGRSWSGKTTLVAELVRAGATYFSDEYAVLDRRGRVYPYPKPLSIRDGETGVQTDHPVESLGGKPATKSLPVGLVLISRYETDSVWRPKKLTAGDGTMALSDNSISIRRSPRLVLEVLRKVTSEASIIEGTRGEAEQVVQYLLQNYPRWP